MKLVICSHCGTQVAPAADGSCPSCRGSLAPQEKRGIFEGRPWFTDEATGGREQQSPKTASMNPYEAPTFEAWKAARDTAPPPKSLAWILFSFEGRIPRRVYWGASIGMAVIFYAYVLLFVGIFGQESDAANLSLLAIYPFLLWTQFAIAAKRWHDRDKSGWWILIGLIPLIGPIWAFIENGCLRGTYGENEYGPDPT